MIDSLQQFEACLVQVEAVVGCIVGSHILGCLHMAADVDRTEVEERRQWRPDSQEWALVDQCREEEG